MLDKWNYNCNLMGLMIYGNTDLDGDVSSIEDNAATLWKTAGGAVGHDGHVVWNFQDSHHCEVL